MFLRMSEQTYDPTLSNKPEDGHSSNIHHDDPEIHVNLLIYSFSVFRAPAKVTSVSYFIQRRNWDSLMLSYLRRSNRTVNGKSTEDAVRISASVSTDSREPWKRLSEQVSGLAVIRTGKIPKMKQYYHYWLFNDPISSSCVAQGESNGSMNED